MKSNFDSDHGMNFNFIAEATKYILSANHFSSPNWMTLFFNTLHPIVSISNESWHLVNSFCVFAVHLALRSSKEALFKCTWRTWELGYTSSLQHPLKIVFICLFQVSYSMCINHICKGTFKLCLWNDNNNSALHHPQKHLDQQVILN